MQVWAGLLLPGRSQVSSNGARLTYPGSSEERVRFGSNSEIQPDCIDDFSPRRRSGSRFNRGQDPACGGGMLESAGFDLAVGSLSDLAK